MQAIPLVVIILLILTGCSNKAFYEGIQISNKHECSKVPPSHYDECMQRNTKSYDEYEQAKKGKL